MNLIRTLFSFSGTIDRRAYVLVALCGALVKHALDLSLATLVFHREWGPLNYLVPLGAPVPLHALSPSDVTFVGWMLTASIPFAWVGLAITVKRFRTIGWPVWSVLLFFVPIANIVSFAIAALWPEPSAGIVAEREGGRAPRWLSRWLPHDGVGIALVASIVPAIFGLILVAFATELFQSYGWALFAAVPFAQGAIAVVIYGADRRRTVYESLTIACLSSLLALVGLLAVALEGGVCILMASPIVLAMAAAGGLLGQVMQAGRRDLRYDVASLAVLALIAPTIMGAEAVVPRETPTYMVRSEIIVNAPPATVWRHVISFPDLPPPTALPFRIGIAYPERARIVGRGVGAIRYCEFSTGDFVEPVTDWEPGKRLAFRVARSAEPMREWSPYAGLDPPHLHGYMVSKHGEFDLEALPGGRTRLIGITWYQHHLWPASYWAVYSDAIVHQIHLSVLEHVKVLSEADRRTY